MNPSKYLQLPKNKPDPKKTEGLCKCRPVCKSRRRNWKGEEQKTSAELLLERKPPTECFRRWPHKIYPNSPCPLFGTKRRLVIEERNTVIPEPSVVRICAAPIHDKVETPYLRLVKLTEKIGTSHDLIGTGPFCTCEGCCPFVTKEYQLHDAEREMSRRSDMRKFDFRVKKEYNKMKIMYN